MRYERRTGSAGQGAGAEALAYWLDLECLSPAEVPARGPNGRAFHVVRGAREIPWPGGRAAAPGGQGHLVRIGLFDVAAAYARIAELLGAGVEERHDAPRAQGGFLASFRTDPEGRLVADSFRPTQFALRFATLPHGSPTPSELEERRRHMVRSFAETGPDASGPLDMHGLLAVEGWLRDTLRQRPGFAEEPRAPFAHFTRIEGDDEDEAEFLDSFIHPDLSRVASAWRREEAGAALVRYLAPDDIADADRRDADDPAVAADALDPALTGRSKWPSRGSGDHAAVLRQQMAVSAAGALEAGILAVNGPPGTGKSTLLRDVVAEAIGRRALALCAFRAPMDAFAKAPGGRGWILDPSLRGHGILVCSGNNKAVENVTRELPSPEAIAPSHRADPAFLGRVGALAGVASRIGGGQPAWGLVSAALGKRSNRRRFAEAFWPDRGTGDRIVLDAPVLLGTGASGTAKNGNEWVDALLSDASGSHEVRAWGDLAARLAQHAATRKGGPVARRAVLKVNEWTPDSRGGRVRAPVRSLNLAALSDDPPETGVREALGVPPGPGEWAAAVAGFRRAWDAAGELVSATEALAHGPARLRQLDVVLRLRLDAAARTGARLADVVPDAEAAEARLARMRKSYAEAGARVLAADAGRPGLVARLFSTPANSAWRAETRNAANALQSAERALGAASAAAVAAVNARAKVLRDLSEAEEAVAGTRAERESIGAAFRSARVRLAGDPVSTDALWELPHAEREAGNAWGTPELDRAREEVFAAAFELHALFLRAASGPVLDNLRLHLDLLAGDRDAARAAAPVAGDAWDTFFLAVPVVSSTFSSLGSMFGDAIGPGGLGWVLVDEAGQARPQDPVGAIWRGRRVLMVGDPKQVEPVVRIPEGVSAFLARHHGVANPAFDPCIGSAQGMADRRAALGTWLGEGDARTWVGCPLRVHRRCDEPMFGISNAVSYGGSMVLGKPAPDFGSWTGRFPDWGPGGRESSWIDIRGAGGEGKWAPAAAGMARRILLRMAGQGGLSEGLRLPDGSPAPRMHVTPDGLPDAFVITPFTDVASRFRREVVADHARFAALVPGLAKETLRAWADSRVGTVHAFQGGEAPTVILLLGGHSGTRKAIHWATSRANLLNVAVTRARSSLYVVGNRDLWLQGAFKAASGLPCAETPSYVATAPDPREVERIGTLDRHLDALGQALSEARERVVICSPFLRDRAVEHPSLPVPELVRRAVARGVSVTVYADGLFNASGQDAASARAAEAVLTGAGARVERVKGLHAKTLCVDRAWIVDGSFNWLSSPRDGSLRRHEASYLYRGREAGAHIDEALAAVRELQPWEGD
jgi:hypothetical protein